MPRGAPDYSNVRSPDDLHRLDDMAELAARLGSVITHNREGSVLFTESFEFGVANWYPIAVGSGADIIVTAERFRSRGYSVKLISASNIEQSTQLTARLPHPALSRYGLEYFLSVGDDVATMDCAMSRYDGTYYHEFRARYNDITDTIQIKHSDGQYYTVMADAELSSGKQPFNSLKLVGDLENDDYVRLIVNGRLASLDGYKAFKDVSSNTPLLQLLLLFGGRGGYNGFVYVDDVILTRNEP